nr:hypothetical protein [Tanacetum cinerariifolium]
VGLLNSTRAKDVLEAQYGPGFQSNKYIPLYAWFGNNVALMYDENSVTHDAKITFSDKSIAAQEQIDKKEAAKKAASDL